MRKKDIYLTIDTETCGTLEEPIVYDLGGCFHDRYGNVIETFSFVIKDVFEGMADIMETAYYAKKLPQYKIDLENGTREMVTYYQAKKFIAKKCKEYNVRAIIAHNMKFDNKATRNTQKVLTDGKYISFLPYGIELWDTLEMAKQVIQFKPSYMRFCDNEGYLNYLNYPQLTAEILYRFISGIYDFEEEHTGLADVLIEKEIFAYIVKQKCFTKIKKTCY